MKTCNRCNRTLPAEDFPLRGPSRPGQRRTTCWDCERARKRDARARRTPEQRNRDRERMAEWRANRTPEQRELALEAAQRYRATRSPEQHERDLERSRRWKANRAPEQIVKDQERERKRNPSPRHRGPTWRMENGRAVRVPRRCPICQAAFTPTHGNQRYCDQHARGNLEAENARKRHWERERAGDCQDCGAHLTTPGPVRCSRCDLERKKAQGRSRTERWLEMRRAGMGSREIAELEGVAPHVVAGKLQRSSVARYPGLEWVRDPYFDRGKS